MIYVYTLYLNSWSFWSKISPSSTSTLYYSSMISTFNYNSIFCVGIYDSSTNTDRGNKYIMKQQSHLFIHLFLTLQLSIYYLIVIARIIQGQVTSREDSPTPTNPPSLKGNKGSLSFIHHTYGFVTIICAAFLLLIVICLIFIFKSRYYSKVRIIPHIII